MSLIFFSSTNQQKNKKNFQRMYKKYSYQAYYISIQQNIHLVTQSIYPLNRDFGGSGQVGSSKKLFVTGQLRKIAVCSNSCSESAW